MNTSHNDCNTLLCTRAYKLIEEYSIKTYGKMSQPKMEKFIGIPQATISKIKSTHDYPDEKPYTPQADTVYKIAKAFNVSTDYLLGVTDYKTTDRATKELCNTLGLSENTINVLVGESNSPIADITRKSMTNRGFLEDEEFISQNTLGYGKLFAQAIDWLVEDAISVYSKTEFIAGKEQPFIALVGDYINRLDLSNKDGDFEVSEFTQEELPLEKFPHIKGKQLLYTHRFSIENSILEIVGDDGESSLILPPIRNLLIETTIGEINTRLHNIKHEKLGE